MKKLLLLMTLLPVLAFGQAPGLVFKRDRVVPVIATTIWTDADLAFLGAVPSVDGLVGYDPTPERLNVGYQAVLNWSLTQNTTVYAGGAYLAPIGEVRFSDLWDRLGLAVGVRIRL